MQYASIFSGIEAASVAVERIGLPWHPVAFAEIDPAACAVLRHRWPAVPNLGDVALADWSSLRGRVDVLLGGPPCQDFSVGGHGAGLDGKRGNLTREYLNALDQLRPEWAVLENVAGLLSSNGGRDLGTLLRRLAELGYCTCWRVLDAQFFGVAQRRRRIFLVLHRGDEWEAPAEVLGLAQGERRYPVEELASWAMPARRAGEDAAVGSQPGLIQAFNNTGIGCWSAARDVAATLRRAGGGRDSTLVVVHGDQGAVGLRRLTPVEYLRLMGFDDDHLDGARWRGKPLSDTVRYRLVANSWAVPVASWILERLSAVDELIGAEAGRMAMAA